MTLKMVKNEGYTVQLVKLSGVEWAKVSTLAKTFGIGGDFMRETIVRLQQTHEVRVLQLGEKTQVVNVADFYRALFDCVPVVNQLAKGL